MLLYGIYVPLNPVVHLLCARRGPDPIIFFFFFFFFFLLQSTGQQHKGEVDKSGQANFDNTEERGMRADEVGQPPPT